MISMLHVTDSRVCLSLNQEKATYTFNKEVYLNFSSYVGKSAFK